MRRINLSLSCRLVSSCPYRKEFENNQLLSKIADEQTINNQLQKKMKELHVINLRLKFFIYQPVATDCPLMMVCTLFALRLVLKN